MKTRVVPTVLAGLLLGLAPPRPGAASEKPDPAGARKIVFVSDKSSLVGAWRWPVNAGNPARDMTLRLRLVGDNLTGALGRGGRDIPVEAVTYKDGELSFAITRERGGQKFVTRYTGKVAGNVITGRTEFERPGQTFTRPWEAKRAK